MRRRKGDREEKKEKLSTTVFLVGVKEKLEILFFFFSVQFIRF